MHHAPAFNKINRRSSLEFSSFTVRQVREDCFADLEEMKIVLTSKSTRNVNILVKYTTYCRVEEFSIFYGNDQTCIKGSNEIHMTKLYVITSEEVRVTIQELKSVQCCCCCVVVVLRPR